MARNYESAILLTGDASGAVRAIELTDDHLRQLNARQQRNQATTREQSASWETLSNSLKGAAAALGLSVAGIAALSTNQLRAVTETDRLAKSIGVQTDRLQAMQYAAKFAGLESDNMGDILKDVADKIGDAVSNGGGEAIDVINNLGLSAQRLVAMSPDEQLLAIADGLDRLGSRAQQVNALEALGNDASRLLPLLENNAAELRRLMQEGYDLNVAMRPEDIDSFVQAQSAIETMGAAVQGLSNTLLIDLAPVVTDSVESIRDWIDEAGGMEVVVDRIATAFGVAIDIAEVLFAVWLGRRASAALTASAGLFTALGTAGATAMGVLSASTTGLNRALLVTQGRIAATTAAARGLSGAMALMGGPAGAAILAAGALYTYREEIQDLYQPTKRAEQAVRDLTDAIDLNSRSAVQSRLDNLKSQMIELQAEAATTQAEIDKLNDENGVAGPFRNSLVQGAGAEQRAELIRQRMAATDQIAATREAIGQMEEQLQKLGPAATTINRGVVSMIDGWFSGGNGGGINDIPPTLSDAADAASQFDDSLRGLLDRIDPLAKSQREFLQDQALLQTALLSNKLTTEEYFRAVDQLSSSYENAGYWADEYGLKATSATTQAKEETDDFTVFFERSMERLDDAGTDVWENFFESGRLSFDSLTDYATQAAAEILNAFTFRPITASLSNSILGMSGNGTQASGTASSFDIGDLSSIGSSLWDGGFDTATRAYNAFMGTGSTYGGTFGSELVATGNGGFLSASNSLSSSLGSGLSTVGGGLIGSTAGNAIFGESEYGSTLSTLGAFAGSFIPGIGTLAGSALGSFIGSGLGSLFGSSREPFAKTWAGQQNADPMNFYRDYYAYTDLGTVGILDKQKMDPEPLVQWVEGIEQMDNALASMLDDSQLSAVQDELADPSKYKGTDLSSVTEDRYDRAIDAIIDSSSDMVGELVSRVGDIQAENIEDQANELAAALQLGSIIDSSSGVVKDYATQVADDLSMSLTDALADVQSSIAANSLLSTAAESLNLQFDALADGAIEAGNRIAELAGGVDSLSSTYSSYYQAVFSDNERLSDSYQSLVEQFDALGVEMPNSVDALRDLVESQALNTDESRKLQLQLMQLAPTFAETTSSIRDALTQQYQDVLDRAPDAEGLNYWIDEIQSGSVSLEHALASIANSAEATTAELKEIMQSASDAYESAMSQARDYLAGITSSLGEYLDQLHSTDAGLASPGDQLAAAAGAFSEQYQLALSGDRDALGSITQYASRLIDAQTQWSGSGTQTQDVIADITRKLEQLPERLSPEQFLAEEIRDAITDGISDLTDGIATTIAGSFDAIDFNQDDVIDWSEFRRQFDGLVDNDTLRDIFGALDNNGNGVIDQLESDARAIEAWSSQQPESAQSAIQQMLDMYEEILGRQADLPGIDYYLDQYFDGMSLEEIRARLEDSPEAGGGSSSGSGATGGSYKPGGSDAEGDPLLSDATGDLADAFRDVLGRDPDDSGYAYYQDQLNSGSMTLDEIRDRLADSPEANGYALGGAFVGGVQAFAKGGAFTNGIVTEPTPFDMGLMGEAGPEAIMPLSRGAGGVLGVRAEFPPVVMPPPSAMGATLNALEQLLRENNRLMQENTALLKRLDAHGAAGVRVAQAGHQRQIEATERGNRSLEDLAAGSRLEHAR